MCGTLVPKELQNLVKYYNRPVKTFNDGDYHYREQLMIYKDGKVEIVGFETASEPNKRDITVYRDVYSPNRKYKFFEQFYSRSEIIQGIFDETKGDMILSTRKIFKVDYTFRDRLNAPYRELIKDK